MISIGQVDPSRRFAPDGITGSDDYGMQNEWDVVAEVRPL
jgi:hypothetical protein